MRVVVLSCVLAVACGGAPHEHPAPRGGPPPVPRPGSRTISIVGTNDLHGALTRLPLLGGFLDNLRAARAADGGGVLLVDAGDLFQGTLESNLAEGADVIKAYNQLGYAASAVGNHEFDFGPEGELVIAKAPEQDPRGALKARAAEAAFPFLVTNIVDEQSGHRNKWPNMPASTIVTVAGTQIGILGASTEATPYTTMAANFVGLKMGQPTAKYIADEAKALRDRGAQIVVLVSHIGSSCKDNTKADDLSSCDTNGELFKVLSDVPSGLVDVVVAGHTHAAIAHRFDGMAVIESWSSGRGFGRVDLRVTDSHVSAVTIHKPKLVCPIDAEGNPQGLSECKPGDYEGKPVVADAAVQKLVDDAMDRTAGRRNASLGVMLSGPITRAYKTESVEGDWFTDLMLAARPDAEVAMTNGGGLRADITSGPLTYGKLFEAMPFDNRFALVTVQGKHIRRLITTNLQRDGGIFSWSGLTVKAGCEHGALALEIKVGKRMLADDAKYVVATTDFLASGGDGVFGRLKLPDGSITPTEVIVRDAMADVLRKRKGTVEPDTIYTPAHPRLQYEGTRPLLCGGPKTQKLEEPD